VFAIESCYVVQAGLVPVGSTESPASSSLPESLELQKGATSLGLKALFGGRGRRGSKFVIILSLKSINLPFLRNEL
jgi:hypothetical protein